MLAKIKKMFGILPLIAALFIATLAAISSVIGLMDIFPNSKIIIAILGTALEIGKFSIVACMHLYEHELSRSYKNVLWVSLAILILITALGIFGNLSKGYGGKFDAFSSWVEEKDDKENKKGVIDNKISESKYHASENNISRLQEAENNLDFNDPNSIKKVQAIIGTKPDGIWDIKTKKAQQDFINYHNKIINNFDNRTTIKIDDDTVRLSELDKKISDFQKEFGPIAYLSKFLVKWIYPERDKNDPEIIKETMKLSIDILVGVLMFMFDPLAIVLTILSLHILLPSEHKKPNNKKENSTIKLTIKLINDFINRKRYSDNRILKGKYFPDDAEINDIFVITDEKKKGMYKFNGVIWEAI